jgi:hypothetical protein
VPVIQNNAWKGDFVSKVGLAERETLLELLVCFMSREPGVHVLGNVRADDAAKAIRAALESADEAARAEFFDLQPFHLRIIADLGSVPAMQSALRMAADQLDAAKESVADEYKLRFHNGFHNESSSGEPSLSTL